MPAFAAPRLRQLPPDLQDALRAALDMLPFDPVAGLGVGRSDGTGTPTAVANTFPSTFPGFSGGTTPLCALTPFGVQIGVMPPSTSLRRMLIDFEGSNAAGSLNTAIVVSRPTPQSGLDLMGLQFGFPGTPPPVQLPDGLEIWTTNSPVVFFVGSTTLTPNAPLQFLLTSPLPAGRPQVSAQLFSGTIMNPITAGIFPNCTITTTAALTPALWF